MSELTAERLRELLHYNPETGEFTWLAAPRAQRQAGDRAGFANNGYRLIGIAGHRYYEHRLAWLYMAGEWPPENIDHRDLDRANNRWTNLRLATYSQNAQNRPIGKANTSGYKGVYWHKIDEKWRAVIRVGGRRKHLGLFNDKEAAHAAYVAAAEKHYGEFARAA
jgi:hypothetical protein